MDDLKYLRQFRDKEFCQTVQKINTSFNAGLYQRAIDSGMPQNEESAYVEHELIQGLTLYDIYRSPRQLQNVEPRSNTIELKARLNQIITCPVCLGILNKTYVVMKCVHRFCKDCIKKCLRVAKNECPSCRIHIPSQRFLRPDEAFDCLIRQFVPNVESFENQENKRIAKMNEKLHVNNAMLENMKTLKKHQDQAKPWRAVGSSYENLRHRRNDTMDYILRKHPHERKLPYLYAQYLTSARGITILQLKQFLFTMLEPLLMPYMAITPRLDEYQVTLIMDSSHGVVLADNVRLDEVLETIRGQGELVLHYRLDPRSSIAQDPPRTYNCESYLGSS